MQVNNNDLGVKIKNKCPMAFPMHCMCHSSSLPMKNLFSAIDFLSKFQELTFDILKLIKFSPTRENVLKKIKKSAPSDLMWDNLVEAGKVIQWNPTRWKENKRSFMSIVKNYDYLHTTFIKQRRSSETPDSIMRSRCASAAKHLSTFERYYETSLHMCFYDLWIT